MSGVDHPTTPNRRGRLTLTSGGRLHKLATILAKPKLPSMSAWATLAGSA